MAKTITLEARSALIISDSVFNFSTNNLDTTWKIENGSVTKTQTIKENLQDLYIQRGQTSQRPSILSSKTSRSFRMFSMRSAAKV